MIQKTRKIPLRKCVVTNERHPKQDLIRIVKTNEGKVFVDPTGKQNGRGAYLKRSIAVIDKAKKTKKLDRHLETIIDDSLYEELKKLVDDES